ncbi:MAG: BON domain-containing protein [Opitutaceae bacterium]
MKILPTHRIATIALSCTVALAGLGAGGCAATTTRESTGEYVDDSAITAKVKTALIGDPAVKSFQIDVTTFRGIVQLSGFVDNAVQRAAAQRDAQGVAGVRQVEDRISLKSP